MPTTIKVVIAPNALMEGDIITEVEFPNQKVISGKTKMVGSRVASVSTGKANATVDTDRGKLILKLDSDVWVRREVLTEEEHAAKKAADAAVYRDFQMKSVYRKLTSTYTELAGARQALADAALWDNTDTLMRHTYEVAECDARRRIAERMLLATGQTRNDGDKPLDILEATKLVAIAAARELLDRGADDSWSGRGNDLRRAIFDAQRNFIRDLRYEGVKVFDVDMEWY